MKNIIPFKKEVIFKTNISEITSISLEHTLNLKDDIVGGEFNISGEYKISDNSNTVEPFNLNIPFEIVIDDRFNTEVATIDIDDFYYEIVNDNVLSISIDVLVDHLKENKIETLEDLTPKREIIEADIEEERCIEPEDEVIEKRNIEDKVNSLFSSNNFDNDVYVTYNIYIIKDGDNLDNIIEKYNTNIEDIKKYNDITNLQIGDKLIIPTSTYEGN